MIRFFFSLLLGFSFFQLNAQTASIKGLLQDTEGTEVSFASVALFSEKDSSLIKAETTNEAGIFTIQGLNQGTYFLKSSYVGLADFQKRGIEIKEGQQLDLGLLTFQANSTELAETVVTAQRVMIEVRPDRTVFNVQGTINSTGSNGLDLLRKAPSVVVDNNNNINVLGRSGVLVYVDGKRLPLSGDDLSNYLQNIQAEQIDRIDIITNPGAKYEAEGNAGIIDIRLKKDKSLGANASINATGSQGRYARGNLGANGNYRNKAMNVFASLGTNKGTYFNDMTFYSLQNSFVLDEINNTKSQREGYDYRVGTDFFLKPKHTVGFLITGQQNWGDVDGVNRIKISDQPTAERVDSILVTNSVENSRRQNNSFNVNYRFDDRASGQSLNFDVDYGRYAMKSNRYVPNFYYDAAEQDIFSEVINRFDTPTDIDIYTAKIDYESKLFGGKFGIGSKVSKVVSDNTFLFFDEKNGQVTQNNQNSNTFKYDENVYAGYVSYARKLNTKWNMSAGLRAEQTDATGDLTAFLPSLQQPPVELNYLSWFPNIGLTYQASRMHNFNFNIGRRINRPDYNVLNPFNNRLSELSYSKGNPRLNPEIVNNAEIGYTYAYRYNFKAAYSRTTNQITRLIAPDDENPKAGYISWDNLAEQEVYNLSLSAPFSATKWWDVYMNANVSYIDNQADYGDGAVVDVQALTYSIFQQSTFKLPWSLKGEISSWYGGPGVWGGVFKYDPSWSLNIGLQRKFFEKKLNVRLAADDLFYQSFWTGVSSFDGLVATGKGQWDSRRVSLSLNYTFGNQNVKSRKRKTGIEDEAGRVGN